MPSTAYTGPLFLSLLLALTSQLHAAQGSPLQSIPKTCAIAHDSDPLLKPPFTCLNEQQWDRLSNDERAEYAATIPPAALLAHAIMIERLSPRKTVARMDRAMRLRSEYAATHMTDEDKKSIQSIASQGDALGQHCVNLLTSQFNACHFQGVYAEQFALMANALTTFQTALSDPGAPIVIQSLLDSQVTSENTVCQGAFNYFKTHAEVVLETLRRVSHQNHSPSYHPRYIDPADPARHTWGTDLIPFSKLHLLSDYHRGQYLKTIPLLQLAVDAAAEAYCSGWDANQDPHFYRALHLQDAAAEQQAAQDNTPTPLKQELEKAGDEFRQALCEAKVNGSRRRFEKKEACEAQLLELIEQVKTSQVNVAQQTSARLLSMVANAHQKTFATLEKGNHFMAAYFDAERRIFTNAHRLILEVINPPNTSYFELKNYARRQECKQQIAWEAAACTPTTSVLRGGSDADGDAKYYATSDKEVELYALFDPCQPTDDPRYDDCECPTE